MNTIITKKCKFIVLVLSLCLCCLNPVKLMAQVAPDPDTSADDTATEETTTETMTETTTEGTTTTGGATSGVPDASAPTEETNTGSSGGSGGGAGILVLGVAGLALANMSSAAKKPKIEKTFVHDLNLSEQFHLIEYHTDRDAVQGEQKIGLSLQTGSNIATNNPRSFVNLRLARQLSGTLMLQANLGTSWQQSSLAGKLITGDWLSVGISKHNVLAKGDLLNWSAQYVSRSQKSTTLDTFHNLTQLSLTENFRGAFVSEVSQIELAYLRKLQKNQQLGFSLAAYESNQLTGRKATVVWLKRF